ncbi:MULTISPECIES: hypothetical protein [Actinomadura]|uniref:pPIWI-RE three-gene island domain-containing protein n=2 Tax=Actinomadura yumaensis TaxID=111807 RepID=A0ABW2CUS1_9ACTN|nr:hypothetical protein [Actinomadura sp. J1-007]MWK36335.1 hypothetical protein [Actinomadura sp. J1-007]
MKEALNEVSASQAAEFRQLQEVGLDYRVELGLYLLARVDENLKPIDGWTLFGGYPFGRTRRFGKDPAGSEIDVMLRAGRYHLEPMHRRAVWEAALRNYLRRLPARHRLFDFPNSLDSPATWEKPSLATARTGVYDHLLSTDAPFAESAMKLAEAGDHYFQGRRSGVQGVTIPEGLPDAGERGMNLHFRTDRTHFDQPVEALERTASLMAELDQEDLPGEYERKTDDWDRRFQSMELFVRRDESEEFQNADNNLVIDGVLNMIGIPGVGKSTLRDILTAHAVAELEQHVVIVVGDVAEALRTVQRFNRLRAAAEQHEGDPRFAGFTSLRAAPLIGTTTREQHLRRLHRRVSRRYPLPTFQHDPAFAFLSTACPLSALRGAEADVPIPYAEAPCTRLKPARTAPDAVPDTDRPAFSTRSPSRGCPLWSFCPRHDIERALRDATIWVTTPESLATTSLPPHMNRERLRYLELACRRSDLIIVDEADQVQIRLDRVFAPTATLYKPGTDSWLDELDRHNVAELAREGRIQLSDSLVERWTLALDTVSTSANRIYAMLVKDGQLREWVGTDFFSPWTLQQELVGRWPATRRPEREEADSDKQRPPRRRRKERTTQRRESARLLRLLDAHPDQPQEVRNKRREYVQAILDAFRDDPLGDHDDGDPGDASPVSETRRLSDLARRLILNGPENPGVEREVRTALQSLSGLLAPSADGDEATGSGRTSRSRAPKKAGDSDEGASTQDLVEEFEREQQRFAFTLLLSVMHDRLNVLTSLWGRVEAALRLDPATNELYHGTPPDYAPVVPESPMGNVLAFQFAADRRAAYAHTGELRFVRCHGVGRELLRAIPSLHSVEGSRGPNVLLMSGTSWAGMSTRYHLAEPVRAVLQAAPRRERNDRSSPDSGPLITMIENYVHDLDEDTGQVRPLRLSGSGDRRTEMVRKMVRRLADPKPDGGEAPLLREFHHLREHRSDRAHLLLLTGSYDQARVAAQTLHSYSFWKGQVCVLIPDDMDADIPLGDDVDTVPTLRRGDVASLRETPYTVLVAPLMAVERGHNILNSLDEAFFGSVFFLVRPFPAPSDLGVLIHSLNDWTVRSVRIGNGFEKVVRESVSLDAAGLEWRHQARRHLHWLANRELTWSNLTPADRERLTWDLLVVIWQVIGRLTRGGVDARVHFVDAAFAPLRAEGKKNETSSSSLLVSMHDVLAYYFGHPTITPLKPISDRLSATPGNIHLAKALYRPLFNALRDLLAGPPPPVPAKAHQPQ